MRIDFVLPAEREGAERTEQPRERAFDALLNDVVEQRRVERERQVEAEVEAEAARRTAPRTALPSEPPPAPPGEASAQQRAGTEPRATARARAAETESAEGAVEAEEPQTPADRARVDAVLLGQVAAAIAQIVAPARQELAPAGEDNAQAAALQAALTSPINTPAEAPGPALLASPEETAAFATALAAAERGVGNPQGGGAGQPVVAAQEVPVPAPLPTPPAPPVEIPGLPQPAVNEAALGLQTAVVSPNRAGALPGRGAQAAVPAQANALLANPIAPPTAAQASVVPPTAVPVAPAAALPPAAITQATVQPPATGISEQGVPVPEVINLVTPPVVAAVGADQLAAQAVEQAAEPAPTTPTPQVPTATPLAPPVQAQAAAAEAATERAALQGRAAVSEGRARALSEARAEAERLAAEPTTQQAAVPVAPEPPATNTRLGARQANEQPPLPTEQPRARVPANELRNHPAPGGFEPFAQVVAAQPPEGGVYTPARGRRHHEAEPITRVEAFARGARAGSALSAYAGRGHEGAEHGTETTMRGRPPQVEERIVREEGAALGLETFANTAKLLVHHAPTAATPTAPQAELARAPVPAAPPPVELPDVNFASTANGQLEKASISLHHPDLGPIQLQVQREAGRVEVHALIESAHAAAVLRANESSIRQGVQQSGMALSGLRVRMRDEDEGPATPERPGTGRKTPRRTERRT